MEDNYAYVLYDVASKKAALVDPVNPEEVLKQVKALGLSVECILTTHHHADHSGGNQELAAQLPLSLRVYGGETLPALTDLLSARTEFKLGSLSITAIPVPCHTKGSLFYWIQSGTQSTVFTGDTVFVGGCGKFFEGTAEQMTEALLQLSQLPPYTRVYCGHEYTAGNMAFGLLAEPDNDAIKAKLSWAYKERSKGHPTVPSTVEEEQAINVFLRAATTGFERVRYLREWKDGDWRNGWKPNL